MRKCSIIPWFIRICKGVAALYYTYSGIKYLLRSNIVPERVYSETDKRVAKIHPSTTLWVTIRLSEVEI